ncbi:MAG: TetR/AcrR family transcriptional regulator C-terminal domain-containing protein [Anaerovoracaceae bacterium]|jgi:AcrR family transcriptional regulator
MASSTEQQLADALRKLLEKKPLTKITVRDITDACGVNRQTFYYHFHDIYDLVEWIFKQDADRFVYSRKLDPDDWRGTVESLMDGLAKDKSFILNAYYSLNRRQLELFMQKLARPAIEAMVKNVGASAYIAEDDINFIIDIATYALIGILMEWIGEGMPDTYRQHLNKLFVMLDGVLTMAVNNFKLK